MREEIYAIRVSLSLRSLALSWIMKDLSSLIDSIFLFIFSMNFWDCNENYFYLVANCHFRFIFSAKIDAIPFYEMSIPLGLLVLVRMFLTNEFSSPLSDYSDEVDYLIFFGKLCIFVDFYSTCTLELFLDIFLSDFWLLEEISLRA